MVLGLSDPCSRKVTHDGHADDRPDHREHGDDGADDDYDGDDDDDER